jgi:hypothetical protein
MRERLLRRRMEVASQVMPVVTFVEGEEIRTGDCLIL